MAEKSHAMILALVGMPNSGVQAAVEHLTGKGIPKISTENTLPAEVVREATNLLHAGQHCIVIGNLTDTETLRSLKHEHPGTVRLVAVLASKHTRQTRGNDNIIELDNNVLENTNVAALIATADEYIVNDENLDKFYSELNELISK